MADPNSDYNQMLRAVKEEKEIKKQQAEEGAEWLRQRQIQAELNQLRAEKIMRMQRGQQ